MHVCVLEHIVIAILQNGLMDIYESKIEVPRDVRNSKGP